MNMTWLRSYGEFDLYHVQVVPHRSRFWLKYRDLLLGDMHIKPSDEDIRLKVEEWITGRLNFIDVQVEHVEPLIDQQNVLVRGAAESFEFHIQNPTEFVRDPFEFKLMEPGTYLVFLLGKYIDWQYFSSSDLGKFHPANASDTKGFRTFLNDWVTRSKQDKIDRELKRQQLQKNIQDVKMALLEWTTS